jgi:cytidylate kinase
VAPKEFRLTIAAERLGGDPKLAERTLEETDRNRARYHREYYQRDWSDPVHFHMVLNTALLGMDGAARVIVAQARILGWDRADANS